MALPYVVADDELANPLIRITPELAVAAVGAAAGLAAIGPNAERRARGDFGRCGSHAATSRCKVTDQGMLRRDGGDQKRVVEVTGGSVPGDTVGRRLTKKK